MALSIDTRESVFAAKSNSWLLWQESDRNAVDPFEQSRPTQYQFTSWGDTTFNWEDTAERLVIGLGNARRRIIDASLSALSAIEHRIRPSSRPLERFEYVDTNGNPQSIIYRQGNYSDLLRQALEISGHTPAAHPSRRSSIRQKIHRRLEEFLSPLSQGLGTGQFGEPYDQPPTFSQLLAQHRFGRRLDGQGIQLVLTATRQFIQANDISIPSRGTPFTYAKVAEPIPAPQIKYVSTALEQRVRELRALQHISVEASSTVPNTFIIHSAREQTSCKVKLLANENHTTVIVSLIDANGNDMPNTLRAYGEGIPENPYDTRDGTLAVTTGIQEALTDFAKNGSVSNVQQKQINSIVNALQQYEKSSTLI